MVLVLTAADVAAALTGREALVVDAVRGAYLAHEAGNTAVPHSVFLRFPGNDADRIIALPAYLGGPEPIAGCKWISSFPENTGKGLPRASAVIILNDMATGAPVAMLEGSLISAARTAASAALAAMTLRGCAIEHLAVIGCGLINATIVGYLAALSPQLHTLTAYDLHPEAAERFDAGSDRTVHVAADLREALHAARTVSFATTATRPYVAAADVGADVDLILHVSLRDLQPDVVETAANVVDDPDHVLRAGTSLVVAGATNLITLGSVLETGAAPAGRPLVFSPFGLGILDLAVASLVLAHAREHGNGVEVDGFAPR